MTVTDRPGLLDVIAAFFAAERQADTYVTEVWCPEPDNGMQRLHSPMKAGPEPEAEL
jgi:hypothetical protein